MGKIREIGESKVNEGGEVGDVGEVGEVGEVGKMIGAEAGEIRENNGHT